MGRAAKIVGIGLLGLLVLALVAAGAGFGLLQTGTGKRWLAAELSRLLSDPSSRVTVSGISGVVPFDMSVQEIRFSDADGTWLTLHGGNLAITGGDLLRGRLTIHDLSAREIDFARRSVSSTSSGFDLAPPLPVGIDRLQVDTLKLGPALLGEPMTLSLAGKGAVGGGSASGDLVLRRIDQTPGEATLHFDYGGEPTHLALAAHVSEPTGKVLADLLGRPAPLPLSIDVAGKGPLADWHGTLTAAAGTEASFTTDVRIKSAGEAGSGGYHLTLNGGGAIEKLLPPKFRPLLGGKPTVSAQIDFGQNDRVVVESLGLRAAFGTLTGRGELDRKTGALAGAATIDTPDLSRLEPVLGIPVSGAGTAEIELSGTTENPHIAVSFMVSNLGVTDAKVQTASGAIGIVGNGPLTAATTVFDLNGSGHLDGIVLASGALLGGLGQHVNWSFYGAADRGTASLRLDDLAIVDAAGPSLDATTTANAQGAGGEARLAIPDLHPFASGDRHGALALAADFTAAMDGSATAAMSGTLDGFSSGQAVLDQALGPTVTLVGTLRRLADGTISIADLTATGAEATLAANGQRRPDGHLDLDYRLDTPHLAALDPRLAGKAVVTGTLGGPPSALAVDTTLTADGLVAGSAHLDRLTAHVALADLTRPAGPVDLSFRAGKLDGTAAARIALDPGVALRLSDLRVQAAGATLSGDARLALADHTVDGRLAGAIPDLRPWSELAGQPLAGSLRLDATLASKGGQSADLALRGAGLSLGAGAASVGSLQLNARLADLFNRPSGTAALQMTGASAGAARLDAVKLNAATTGRADRFDITGQVRGSFHQPLTIAMAGTAAVNRGTVELRLTRLAGTVAGEALALGKTLILTAQGSDVAFADLALRFGGGSLDGDGALKGQALSLHLLGQKLPVAALARLGGKEGVTGDLGFEATVSGTRTQPEGNVVVDGEQLHFAAASNPNLPALGVVASADWHGGRVGFKGRIAGPQGAALGFSGAAPLVMATKGFALHVPPDGALAFRLEGDGDLANLADLLPLGEDRLAGKFVIDISVDGTVAAPAAAGRLTVTDGRYESLAAGTVLTGINFALVGDRDRLVLRDFAATDGTDGRVDVTGAVDLAATPGPALDIAARLTAFRALRRDEATARASGAIRITGTVEAPRITAALRIDEANLRVPERLPQNIQPVAVTRVDSATGKVLSTPEQSAAQKVLLAVQLDITVNAPGQVFVRGRGLDSEWRGQLAITGTTAAPQLTGKLEVVRGSYDLIGKTFRLTQGTITFLGGNRIDPQLDFQAQAQSSDIVATAHITGTVSDPKLQFSSEPALPQDEILARILFGNSLSQISPGQALQIAQAAAALASGGGPGVLDRIRTGLGLDRLSLGSAANAGNALMPGLGVPGMTATGSPGTMQATGIGTSAMPPPATAGGAGGSPLSNTAVSAGKYVADGVYVGVTQGLTAQSSTVTVEVNVTPHITVDTQAGQQTGTGVGVNWKLDY